MQESVRKKIGDRFTKAQVLQAAKDLSATAKLWDNGYKGWLQGRNFDRLVEPQACCSFGGLMLVTGERGEAPRGWDSRVTAACVCFYQMTGQDIVSFNDTDDQTKNQVIAKLRDVAKNLEAF